MSERSSDNWTTLVPAWAGAPLAEDAVGPVMCFDANLRALYVNPQAESVLGVRSGDVLGGTIPSDKSSEFYKRCETMMRRVLETGQDERAELALDGGARHFWCRVAPESAPDGTMNLVVIARDISEAKHAKLALGESAAKIESVMRAIPDMVFRISRDGVILEFIPGIGVTPFTRPGDLVGKKFADVPLPWAGPTGVDVGFRLVDTALSSGEVQTVQYSWMVGGETVHHEARFVPFAPDEVIAVVRDITVQKRAEESLMESEARWRTLVETVPALITTTDLTGRILYVNTPLPPLTGESVVGTSIYDYLEPTAHDQVKETVERVIEAKRMETLEIPAGPGERWYENLVAPIVNAGEVTGVIIVSIDVSERRRLEHELAAARDEIEERIEAVTGANEYGLSFRELTVLALVSEGKSDKEIAAVLGLRPRTVSKHVEKILRKMHCGSRTEAGVRAIREKLVP